jgi:hypothetical protein
LDLLNATFEIASINGQSDQFVTLRGPRGVVTHFGHPEFFHVDELLPAKAKVASSDLPRIVEREEPMSMSLETQMLVLTKDYEKKYNLTMAEAAKRAGRDLLTTPEKQDAYRGLSTPREPLRTPDMNQARAELERVTHERGCTADEAADLIIANAHAARFGQRVMSLRSSGLDPTAALMRAQREDPQGATAWREAGVN